MPVGREPGGADRGFGPLVQVHGWLAGAPARWAFHGGWALDAIAGARSRAHDDVDVTVDRRVGPELLDLLQRAGVEVAWVVDGSIDRRRAAGEAPPAGVHQAHGRRAGRRVDVVLEPWTDVAWRYRPVPAIELPLARAVRRVRIDGVEVPVLAPEAVLLVKATAGGGGRPRPKDDADLRRVRALLEPESAAWLRWALAVTAPGHPWCAAGGPLEVARDVER